MENGTKKGENDKWHDTNEKRWIMAERLKYGNTRKHKIQETRPRKTTEKTNENLTKNKEQRCSTTEHVQLRNVAVSVFVRFSFVFSVVFLGPVCCIHVSMYYSILDILP